MSACSPQCLRMAFEPERSYLGNERTSGLGSFLGRSRVPCWWRGRTAILVVFRWQRPTCWPTWVPAATQSNAGRPEEPPCGARDVYSAVRSGAALARPVTDAFGDFRP